MLTLAIKSPLIDQRYSKFEAQVAMSPVKSLTQMAAMGAGWTGVGPPPKSLTGQN